jgi:phosphopantothenoylcysteine synthetase/decarboxylase
LLGICGSIAAYKACGLIRRLRENGCDVKCVLTAAGGRFITPLTLGELSCNTVYTEFFPENIQYDAHHVSLSDWADIIVIAPASANTIAKLANGIADNLLTATVIASKSPVLICPAMNVNMWRHPATADNVERLKEFGYRFIGPEEGELSCGKTGIGRLADTRKILKKILSI